MFQTICIKPNDSTFPTDIGYIAEKLLYYQNVRLISSPDTLPILINGLGTETLLELLKNRNFKVLMRQNLLAVSSKNLNGLEVTDVTSITSDSLLKEESIFRSIYKSTDRRGYSKRMTQKLIPYIDTIKYQDDICDLVREDLSNIDYVKQSIIDAIKFYNPAYTLRPDEINYEFIKTDSGYLFESNLNYIEINRQLPNNPDGQLINPTGLMLSILETRGDMHLASDLNAEIATNDLNTALMKIKFHDIYKTTTANSSSIFQFNDFILSDGHAIREVINSGAKTFDDFYDILDKADKFRDWLKSVDQDQNIIREYHEAVIKETWVDKLPAKCFRWSIFTGAGLALDAVLTGGIGTAIGVGVSLGDAFLLDKLVKGWKPNVFVDGQLKPFITK